MTDTNHYTIVQQGVGVVGLTYPKPHADTITAALKERVRLMTHDCPLESDYGRLNTRRLSRVFTQSQRPMCFTRPAYGQRLTAPTTRVMVLFDQSGSLQGVYKKFYKAAAPLLQCLIDSDMDYTIASHAQGYRDRIVPKYKPSFWKPGDFTEYINVFGASGDDRNADDIVTAIIKHYETHASDFCRHDNLREEWNDDTAALMWAYDTLSPEIAIYDRNIVFVLTDGIPSNANLKVCNRGSDPSARVQVRETYRQTVNTVTAAGITVYGVYVDSGYEYENPIADLYPSGYVSTVSADNPYTLAEEVVKLLNNS